MDPHDQQNFTRTYKAPPAEERKTIVTRKEQCVTYPNLIPNSLLNDQFLNDLIRESLPRNYNFEVHKTIWKIKQTNCKRVILQLPEGLIRFGPIIVDIIRSYFEQNGSDSEKQVRFITMGDLTYGACCIDDYLASTMGCDLIVHYAHSCLIPINKLNESIKYLYVFLDIKFDLEHLINCLNHNLDPNKHKIALASTIQFLASTHEVGRRLRQLDFQVVLPQSKPLSSGEVLGCTAPKLAEDINVIVFICDGRFHLEALMIANPGVTSYRYDPYSRKLTHEAYEFEQMCKQRLDAISKVVEVMRRGGTIGFILGTLGRQGNEKVYEKMVERLERHTGCKYLKMLMPEVVQDTLQAVDGIDVWVQIACPRLSIDWGSSFYLPLLNPYEFAQSLKIFLKREKNGCDIGEKKYPMDFYAKFSGYDVTPNHSCTNNPNCACASLD